MTFGFQPQAYIHSSSTRNIKQQRIWYHQLSHLYIINPALNPCPSKLIVYSLSLFLWLFELTSFFSRQCKLNINSEKHIHSFIWWSIIYIACYFLTISKNVRTNFHGRTKYLLYRQGNFLTTNHWKRFSLPFHHSLIIIYKAYNL